MKSAEEFAMKYFAASKANGKIFHQAMEAALAALSQGKTKITLDVTYHPDQETIRQAQAEALQDALDIVKSHCHHWCEGASRCQVIDGVRSLLEKK